MEKLLNFADNIIGIFDLALFDLNKMNKTNFIFNVNFDYFPNLYDRGNVYEGG